ncbi:MAG: stage V sporulation protein B [Clostridiales bacterium]|jgi:stage V sporulation protein B|nr:stage V sporulation protein B [Eubacteriales bacterium]MDH7567521.1 stage V sporulation protein B [Clostridiales bacterium]
MKVDKFYRDSLILTISNLVTGIIGFVFSIILSKQLGPEGLGLYGLIMPVYGLLLCLTSDGLITAVSRISAVYESGKDFRNLNRTFTTISAFILMWSLAVAFLVYINSSNIGSYIIRDSRTSDALKVICPALIFVPLSAILKGYFYGVGRFKTAAVIDIVEKIFRIAVFVGTIRLLSLHDIKSTVTSAYFALTIGELTSFLLLFTVNRMVRRKAVSLKYKSQNRLQLLFNVLVISLPLCLNGFISSILSTASTLLLPRRLVFAGLQYDSALSLIGKFSGMAMNITFLPIIIVGSMMTVLIPDLSLSLSRKDAWAAESRVYQVLKISYLVGISTLIVSLTVPDLLGMLFYGRDDLGGFIKFAAVCCFFNYAASPSFGILNGLGKQNINLRNSLVVSVLGLVLIYLLAGIPDLNIYGYGITLIITSLTALAINIREIKKVCDFRLPLSEVITYAVVGGISYLLLQLLNWVLPDSLPVLRAVLIVISGFILVFFLSDLTQ